MIAPLVNLDMGPTGLLGVPVCGQAVGLRSVNAASQAVDLSLDFIEWHLVHSAGISAGGPDLRRKYNWAWLVRGEHKLGAPFLAFFARSGAFQCPGVLLFIT